MPEIRPRRSAEVEAILRRVMDSMAKGDLAALGRLYNPGPEFRAIGTDPDEWWDAETFLPIVAAQMEELAGMRLAWRDLEGWEAGEVGWAAGRARLTVGAAEADLRFTATLVLDSGVWRIVQYHASEGVPNEQTLGFSLTTTMTEILDSIEPDKDLGPLEGQGIMTLMFTDVEGSTAHARDLGDRAFTTLMQDHAALVADVASRAGGQLIKTVGDGALLAFSSARAAVGSAVEIQRKSTSAQVPYAIRIGLHAGDVVRTPSDVMGFAVNKAARVTSAADGGQIVVSSVVRELVGSDPAYRFGAPFTAELKGIEGVHELVPVEW
jgi:adenylate cyclase